MGYGRHCSGKRDAHFLHSHAEAFRQRRNRTCQSTFFYQRGTIPLYLKLQISNQVSALAKTGTANAVADENCAIRSQQCSSHFGNRRMQMNTITNQFCGSSVILENSARNTGFPMSQRCHSVEQMNAVGSPCMNSRHGFIIGSIGMGDSYSHFVFCPGNKVYCSLFFRGYSHNLYQSLRPVQKVFQ